MTPPLCDVCAAPLPGGGHACTRCITSHRQTLASIRENLPELEAARLRQVRLGRGTGRGGENERLPWDDEAAQLLTEITTTITTWAGHIYADRTTATPGPACSWCEHDTCIAARAERLHTRATTTAADTALGYLSADPVIRWAARQDYAAQLIEDLADAARRILRAIDRHGETVALGPCGNPTPDGYECVQPLRAPLDATWATCPACRASYQVAPRRAALLKQLENRIERPRVIADVLAAYGVKAPYDWIRQRASRGDLPRANTDRPDDPAEYRVGDVLALALNPPVRRGNGRPWKPPPKAPAPVIPVGIIARTARPRALPRTVLRNALTSCHTKSVLDRTVSNTRSPSGPLSGTGRFFMPGRARHPPGAP